MPFTVNLDVPYRCGARRVDGRPCEMVVPHIGTPCVRHRSALVWGDRVRLERTDRGWTQAHLADVAGVSQVEISRLESNQCRPVLSRLLAVAGALRLDVEELFPLRRRTDPSVALAAAS